jgi:hypothetical protein
MADQPHKYKFEVLEGKTIQIEIGETGNAKIQTDAWDSERPLYCAALNGLLTLLETCVENGGKFPVTAVQAAVDELYNKDYKLPKLELNPNPEKYTRLSCELTVKGEASEAQEGLWYLLTSLPGVRRVDFTGEDECDVWDLELEHDADEDFEDDRLTSTLPDDPMAHRRIEGECNACGGECRYDEEGQYVDAVYSE